MRRLADLDDLVVFDRTVRLLHVQSLLAAHRTLGPAERAMLTTALDDIVQLSVSRIRRGRPRHHHPPLRRPRVTTPQLDELFTRIDLTPVGPEERDLIEQAIRLADEAGDEQGAYLARMRLTSSAHMSGDTDALFSSFAWCIARNEQDPVRFPQEVAGNDLLFQYKWMAGRLGSNPAFSRDEVQALTDDMSRRYREAGVSQSGVLQSLVSTAILSGDLAAAVRFQGERDLIPRDDYSHCEACVRSTDARLAHLRGDDSEALRLFDEIIAQDLTCGEEPEAAQAEALLPLLRAGRYDEAVLHHRQSYRAARALPDGFSIIADHLVFCAVTGNAARGLAILERHIHELGRDPLDRASTLYQLLAIGVLLDAVVQAGQGEALVRGSDDPRLAEILGGGCGAPVRRGPRRAGVDRSRPDRLALRRPQWERLLPPEWCSTSAHSRGSGTTCRSTAPCSRRSLRLRRRIPSTRSGGSPGRGRCSSATPRSRTRRCARGSRRSPTTRPAPNCSGSRSPWPSAHSIGSAAETARLERIDALRRDGRDVQADFEQRLGMRLYGEADRRRPRRAPRWKRMPRRPRTRTRPADRGRSAAAG